MTTQRPTEPCLRSPWSSTPGIFKLEHARTFGISKGKQTWLQASALSSRPRKAAPTLSPHSLGSSKSGRLDLDLEEERTISMEKTKNGSHSPRQIEATTLGVQIIPPETSSSLVLESTGSFPQGDHSGPGKAEGKMALSLEGYLLPFSSRSSYTQTSHPRMCTHP